MESETQARPRSHRLSDARLDQIFATVLELVAERGFDALTMDAIAETAHCSKATIYRQWGDKTNLVVEALAHAEDDDEEAPNTGSLRQDLREALIRGYPRFSGQGLLIMALLHAAGRHPDLREALNTRISGKGTSVLETVVARAIARGEVAADCPAIPHLPLLLLARVVFSDDLVGAGHDLDSFLVYLDDVVLPALGVAVPPTD